MDIYRNKNCIILPEINMCTELIREKEGGKQGVGETTQLKVKALWRGQTIMRKMEMLTEFVEEVR